MKARTRSFLFGVSVSLNICYTVLVIFLMFCPKANTPRTINIRLDELLAPPTPITPKTPKLNDAHLYDAKMPTQDITSK